MTKGVRSATSPKWLKNTSQLHRLSNLRTMRLGIRIICLMRTDVGKKIKAAATYRYRRFLTSDWGKSQSHKMFDAHSEVKGRKSIN